MTPWLMISSAPPVLEKKSCACCESFPQGLALLSLSCYSTPCVALPLELPLEMSCCSLTVKVDCFKAKALFCLTRRQ